MCMWKLQEMLTYEYISKEAADDVEVHLLYSALGGSRGTCNLVKVILGSWTQTFQILMSGASG